MQPSRSPAALTPAPTPPERVPAPTGRGEQTGPLDADFYVIRVTQMNGQMAWSSSVWVDSMRHA